MVDQELASDLKLLHARTQRLQRAIIALGATLVAVLIIGATLAVTAGNLPETDPASAAHGMTTSLAAIGPDDHAPTQGADPAAERAERDRIRLIGDEAVHEMAEVEDWPGRGTETDPYVIADHKILTNAETGIHIGNTRLHIIIWQNIIEAGVDTTGIRVTDTPNVVVKENTITGAGTGLHISDSPNALIERNLIQRGNIGIQGTSSPGLMIRENNLTGNHVGARIGTAADTVAEDIFLENNTFIIRPGSNDDAFGAIVYTAGTTITGNTFKLDDGLGLLIRGAGATVSGNAFTGPEGDGVQVGLKGTPDQGKDTVVDHNRFRTLGGNHILVLTTQRVTVHANTHQASNGTATLIDGVRSSSITENTITSMARGIRILGSDSIIIEDNRAEATERSITIINGTGNIIRTNYVTGAAETGIAVFGGVDHRVIGNTLKHGGGHGIFVGESSQNTDVIGNTMDGMAIGIGIGSEASATNVRSNDIMGGGQVGIRVGDSTASTLTDNRIDSMDGGVTVGPGARTLTIRSGYILSSGWGIFTEPGVEDLRVEDTWIAYNGVGAWLIGAERAVVRDNGIELNGQAIFLLRGGNGTITGNHIFDNRVGIHLTFTQGNVIYDNVFANDHLPGDRNAWLQDAPDNVWSIELAEGENIVGGDLVGGNLWHDYVGADLDGDGIGELPYSPLPESDIVAEAYDALGEDPAPRDEHPLMASGPVATPPPALPPEDLPPLPPLPVPWPEGVPTPQEVWNAIPWPSP